MANQEEIDPVLHALGPLGLYACVQCFLFYLSYITDGHQYFSYIFTGKDVGHKCASPSNGSVPDIPEVNGGWLNSTVRYDQCHIYVNSSSSVTSYPCLFGMEYDETKDTSIVSEFDLVCGRQALPGLTQTLVAFGMALGAIGCPWLADLYGRKTMVVAAQVVILAASLMASFAPNYATFAAAKFLIGFALSGNGVIAVAAGVELFPESHRLFISGLVGTVWSVLCVASLSPIAYVLRFHSWRTLQLALTVPSAGLAVLMFFCMNEPLRWLAANGKYGEFERVLTKAAKWNNKDPTSILSDFRGIQPDHDKYATTASHSKTGSVARSQVRESLPAEDASPSEDLIQDNTRVESPPLGSRDLNAVLEERLNFLQLVRHPLLRRQALVMWFIWFVDNLVDSALYLMSDTLAVDLYLGFFLNALMEGVSGVLIIVLGRLGRKTLIAVFHGIAGLGLVINSVCFYYKDSYGVQMAGTVSSLCGKMGTGGAVNVLYFYTSEIFPTNIRNRALGTSVTMSMLGAMIAPYSDLLVDYAAWAPGAVFGACCLLVIIVQFVLPESKGRELPQTLRDLEAWYDVTPPDKAEQTQTQENLQPARVV